ncbi:hypothetical protein B0H12DRAFT_1240847 [Mycena haematopus]|nr:hypothetical protein B0H12DRAFT_1240847 [Mycena haematopus]
MALVDASSPALPVELERAIFEIAAISRPRAIPKFMWLHCVSKYGGSLLSDLDQANFLRVRVEPLLYRTLLLDSPRLNLRDKNSPVTIECGHLISLIHSKPPNFFRDSVRNLCLAHDLEEQEAIILSTCSTIENLWLFRQTRVNVLDFNLPLKHLHCTVERMFPSSQIDFTHRIFSSITHLEIFDIPRRIDPDTWSALTRIPHLTHLAFNDPRFLPLCLALLSTWESLRVLLLVLDEQTDIHFLDNYNATDLAQDRRFVVTVCVNYLHDWIKGIQIGCDYWSRAEDFIAKRLSGEINPLLCYMLNSNGDQDAEG